MLNNFKKKHAYTRMHTHSSIYKAANRVFCEIKQSINKLLVSKQYLHYKIYPMRCPMYLW